MKLSMTQNIYAIIKYLVTGLLVIINSILGMASISLGLFIGLIITNIFFPSYLSTII